MKKKPLSFHYEYWCFNRDLIMAYNNMVHYHSESFLYNSVVFHPLFTLNTHPVFTALLTGTYKTENQRNDAVQGPPNKNCWIHMDF